MHATPGHALPAKFAAPPTTPPAVAVTQRSPVAAAGKNLSVSVVITNLPALMAKLPAKLGPATVFIFIRQANPTASFVDILICLFSNPHLIYF